MKFSLVSAAAAALCIVFAPLAHAEDNHGPVHHAPVVHHKPVPKHHARHRPVHHVKHAPVHHVQPGYHS